MCQRLLCLLPPPAPVPDGDDEEGAPEDEVGARDDGEHPHLRCQQEYHTIMKRAANPDWQW